ncbi:hypothetical protein KCP76_21400 [Salmonella enterica subsp. enterica serovar Weltevreden]|nr:hypothetical protein KCP76_21400 [Salmonella enterica subsp. enterica serovar Weltevreden]
MIAETIRQRHYFPVNHQFISASMWRQPFPTRRASQDLNRVRRTRWNLFSSWCWSSRNATRCLTLITA